MKPNKTVVSKLMAYDKNISVKWNNECHYWEIWYKRPSGRKLITPIVESIYVDGGSAYKFMPLDNRIVDWMYSADTWRHSKKWRWLSKKRYYERKQRDKEKFLNLCQNIAKDQWTLLNNELINPLWGFESDTTKREQSNTSKRVSYGKELNL